MPNINFELNLNKHPKNVTNRSLINALNVQVSDDLSCLQSEYSIKENDYLKQEFANKYIAGYIPCNKEFILFVAPNTWKTDIISANSAGIEISIYRIREQGTLQGNYKGSYDLAECEEVYKTLVWHGGKIKGTFTYNIKSQLIISFGEYDTIDNVLVPLKTINLGTWDSIDNLDPFCDLSLSDSKLSLNPEIKIPSITDFNYVNGLSYKGWYTFFIRYKINSVDYTKWYHIGFPIFLDEIEEVQIFKYFISTMSTINTKTGYGATDVISSVSNTCNTTINLTIDNKSNIFNLYQIGCIVSTKDNIKSFKTLDLNISNSNNIIFLLNISRMEEYSAEELLKQQYNYYNVKNVINYKNRLYLSNYKENSFDNNNLQNLVNNFNINIFKDRLTLSDEYDLVSPKCIYQIRAYIVGDNDVYENRKYLSNNDNNTIIYQIDNTNYNNLISSISLTEYSIDNISDISSYKKFVFEIEKRDYNNSVINIFKNEIDISNIQQIITVQDLSFDIENVFDIKTNNNTDFFQLIYNNNKFGIHGRIKLDYIKVVISNYKIKDNYKNRLKNSTLIPGNYYKLYIHFVNKYGEYTDGILIDISNITADDGIDITKKSDNSFCINRNSNNLSGTFQRINLYKISVNYTNTNLKDIVGYFISYEKVQSVIKLTGYMVPYMYKNYIIQGNTNSFIDYSKVNPINKKWRFYCANIDLYDYLEINFDKVIIEDTDFLQTINVDNSIKYTIIDRLDTRSNINNANFNNKSSINSGNYEEINIKSASIVLAHNFSKDNQFKGSYIELELEDDDFDKINGEYQNRNYQVSLIANDNNLYLSENKTLIKLSDIIDIPDNTSKIIDYGYDGHLTYNSFIIYNNDEVILNSTYNLLVNKLYNSYIGSNVFTVNGNPEPKIDNNHIGCPMAYISMLVYSNKLYESKCFNVAPEIYPVRSEPISSEFQQSMFEFQNNIIVLPQNSVNLFKDRFGIYDNIAPITYTNYRNTFITEFDKRIIRSNIIADESFQNSWRNISPEAYKDITENKGNITNIIAMGTTFLVHTEHSLFMFDRNNTLQNGEGESMQLAMPDVFDIDYKEVFSSDLGVCGLQDNEAYIIDEFGYIFYDNDAHKFYKFAYKKIEEIDFSICQFINKYKPYQVRFANDCESNRLLVNIRYATTENNISNEITLSYNYKINKWISAHSYCFDRAFFTKQMTYFIVDREDNNNIYSQLYLINRYGDNNNITEFQNKNVIKNIIYNQFDNIRDITNKQTFYNSDIYIMINDSYDIMKTIEYLTWKLYKIKNKNTDLEFNSIESREETVEPYCGKSIEVYNDMCDTGTIELSSITSDTKNSSVMNYKLPWWELGNWNLNYLRDIKNANNNKIADNMSRIYGNYFIVHIQFGDEQCRTEFETLDCKLINNRTI